MLEMEWTFSNSQQDALAVLQITCLEVNVESIMFFSPELTQRINEVYSKYKCI